MAATRMMAESALCHSTPRMASDRCVWTEERVKNVIKESTFNQIWFSPQPSASAWSVQCTPFFQDHWGCLYQHQPLNQCWPDPGHYSSGADSGDLSHSQVHPLHHSPTWTYTWSNGWDCRFHLVNPTGVLLLLHHRMMDSISLDIYAW
jgi:hypothetical protein